ncbi:hypothetical protein PPERSA_10325 [Pseudocohnilembus persalinus]|uniref:C3H1-type domain-containing protein n=1 Tax=Pseudocohnilembus persalinus TaxID=266149 RepID=A0A0V0R0D7_PSEPJ|nr:hypothetical protein PPERSA_10325 [Pseudocohnilembus persalinus]|eukprot:KRX07937.1 hypothetical protein PPERSA_10325 [Pseudocohnilembus persalinus]
MSKNLVKFLLSEPQEIQNILLHHKTEQCKIKRKNTDQESQNSENQTENTQEKHTEEQCPFYHAENDRRRVPYVENFEKLDEKNDVSTIFAYSSKQCEEYQCKEFKECSDCNNISEHKFHPLNYKTGKKCKNSQNCQFQNRLFCPDLHENETPRVLPNVKKISDQEQIDEHQQQQKGKKDDQNNKNEKLQDNNKESDFENEENSKPIHLQQNEIELNSQNFYMFQSKNQQLVQNKSPEQASQSSGGSYYPFPQQNFNRNSEKMQNQQQQNYMQQINKIGGNFDPSFYHQQQAQQNYYNNYPQQFSANNSINQQSKMLQQQQKNLNLKQKKHQQQQNQQHQQQNQQNQYQHQYQQQLGFNKPNSMRQMPFVDLDTFKTEACKSQEANHNPKNCIYYHNNCDRRRSPKDFNYSFNMCPNRCMKDECPYSHNKVEQLYHRCRYKSKFCKSYGRDSGKCEYGIYCSFAHYDQEISIKLIHELEPNDTFNIWYYKTVWCPYTNNHDRGQCPYAHNVQDFRRDPAYFDLEPEDCPNWTKSDTVSLYNDGGCPNLLTCNKCHGWKELEYHPKVYKTKKCTNQKNCKKRDCAYYHNESDRNTRDDNYKPAQKVLKGQNTNQFGYNCDLQEMKIYQGMPLDLFKDNHILNKYTIKSNLFFGNNQNSNKYQMKEKGQINPQKNMIYYENNTFANQQQLNMQQIPKSYVVNQMQEYQMKPMNTNMCCPDSPTNTTGPNSFCPSNISNYLSRNNSIDSNQQKSHQTNHSIKTIKTNFNNYQKCNYNSDGEIDPQNIKKSRKQGLNSRKIKYNNNDFNQMNGNQQFLLQQKMNNNRQQNYEQMNKNNKNDFNNFQDINIDNITLNNNPQQVQSYFYNKNNPKRAFSPQQELQMNENNFQFDQQKQQQNQQQYQQQFQMMNKQQMGAYNNNNFSNFNFNQPNHFQQMNFQQQQFMGLNNYSNDYNNGNFMDFNFNNYNQQDLFDQESAQDFNNFNNLFQNMNIQDNSQFQPENIGLQQSNFNALNFNNNGHKNSENFSNSAFQGQNFNSDDDSNYFQTNNNINNNNSNSNQFDSQNQHFTLFQQRDMYNNIK